MTTVIVGPHRYVKMLGVWYHSPADAAWRLPANIVHLLDRIADLEAQVRALTFPTEEA